MASLGSPSPLAAWSAPVLAASDSDMLIIQLVVGVVFAAITAAVAAQRGRSAIGWFFIGLVTGCIGLILVLVLPDLKVQRAREESDRKEKRRLRELLTQERMKNQAFRGHATHRLDAHDRHMGVDTRLPAGDAAVPPSLPSDVDETGLPRTAWYVGRAGGEPEGPMDLAILQERIRGGEVRGATLIWHETMERWTPVSESPLKDLL